MTSEILMHIDEELSAEQRDNLLLSFGNRDGGIRAHLQTQQPHMLFVAYDAEELCPHDLVEIAGESGLHVQLIDL